MFGNVTADGTKVEVSLLSLVLLNIDFVGTTKRKVGNLRNLMLVS